MRTATSGAKGAVWIIASAALLMLSACGSAANDATPTVSIDAIFTAAYQTFAAQAATQLALTPPTETPAPTASPTVPLPSPLPTISFNSPTANAGGTACDNATFVTDVTVPDDTVIAPGASFVKTWKMLNSGKCTWNTNYKMAFVSGDLMGGTAGPVTVPVPPGNQANLSVNLVAPKTNGTYKGFWRMQNASSQPFGNSPWVQIKVGAGSTSTPGPSPTGGPSSTAGPSPTGGAGTFTISGNVANLGGVLVTYTGGTTTTAPNGDYEFTVPAGWSGTVTPSDGGVHTFTPASRSYIDVEEDHTNAQNYTATP